MGFLESLLTRPEVYVLSPSERHFSALQQLLSRSPHVSGNLLYDVGNAVLAAEHGIPEIVTADTDFRRLGSWKITDPVH